ncbi:MAG: pyridine nucleotide-disulfide oxidoreductase [Tenericutes bacterium GWF2_57_13]|nr:MAG: pyridine nucleotide-disulfide oxidoreductase [Tenericutes bacterium GWF2_57_13]
MRHYDLIVIGGSAAGITAAVTARKFYPEKSILMIRDVKNVPIPCGIPYVFGTVNDPMKNLMPVDVMMQNAKVDVVMGTAMKINPDFNIVLMSSGMEEGLTYDRLILATGSDPIVPPLSGIGKQNIFAIRKNPEFHQSMLNQLDQTKNLVIIGGGFIGVEFAEECRKRRPELPITIIEMQEHCLQLVYDPEFCGTAEKGLADQRIQLLTSEKVVSFNGDGAVASVLLESGKVIPADMVILGIGCSANSNLAREAGLRIGPTKGIQVDASMRTSIPNIFACGDCAEKVSFFDGKPTAMKLASIATMEARVAGANVFQLQRKNIGVVGCFATVINQQAYACAGLTETQAKKMGYTIVVGQAEAINRHPGLMPGAAMMKVKLVFDAKTQILLGGQIVGALSAGELINGVSALIGKKATADDLALFQAGTHPALTASPIAYQLVNAAESALLKLRTAA